MRLTHLLFLFLAVFGFFTLEASTIFIEGIKTEVFFNDGDTFKVLSGEYKNERMRIEGYNSLENYGPIHSWGSFSEQDLYDNAKEATNFARNGEWHCDIKHERDAYGRLLAVCSDLAQALLRNGLAHAYSVDESKADKKYLLEQEKAQEEALGLWANGVPTYIITSLHSAEESRDGSLKIKKKTYNRLVSSKDGHSKKWQHNEVYETCQKICNEDAGSCMVYVPYEERYGERRASCLKK